MKIDRPVSFVAKSYVFGMAKMTGWLVAAVLVVSAAALAYQVRLNTTASAATPPDVCFDFNAGTGAVVDYYDNEANDPVNPACPRAVDIPSTIGGTPVTSIGLSAFQNKQITAVTIPSSVTSIGSYAFQDNQLTSVIIPDSVTTLGLGVFQENQLASVVLSASLTIIEQQMFQDNQLTSVAIPDGVTEIRNSSFVSNRLTSLSLPGSLTVVEGFAFMGNRLSSVTIPAGVLSVEAFAFAGNRIETATLAGTNTNLDPTAFAMQTAYQYNQFFDLIYDLAVRDQVLDSIFYTKLYTVNPAQKNGVYVYEGDNFGGHLVNPAPVKLNYVNTQNANISSSEVFTGEGGAGLLKNYFASQGPSVPAPADPFSVTPQEQQAIDDALSVYWRIGQTVSFMAPDIEGYQTPVPAQQTFVLGAADNEHTITYAAVATSGSEAAPSGELSNTGQPLSVVLGLSLMAVAGSVMIVSRVLTARS